jgi:hypothetical protein
MLEIIVLYDEFEMDRGYVREVTFTDNLTGALDEVTLQIVDPNHDWINSWVPHKNDRIRFEARLDDAVLKVPDFFVDSWDLSTWPGEVGLRALSEKIVKSELRKRRTVNHYDVTLRGLVSGLAQRNGLKLIWEGDDTPQVAMLRQKNMSDLAYLDKIARETGRVCKVQNGYLIFIPLSFGGTTLERFGEIVRLVPGSGKRTIVINPSDMVAQPKITHSGDVPNKREFRRYQPIQARLDRVRGETTDETFDGGVSTAVNLGFGAESACWSAALEAHLAGVSILFGTLPRVDIAAGSLVYLNEIGTYSGTYLVRKMSHKIGSGGWICEIEAGRISAAELSAPTKAQRVTNSAENTAKIAAEIDAKELAKTKALDAMMNTDAISGGPPKPHSLGEQLAWYEKARMGQ